MTAVTANGNTYSDDGSTSKDMQYGGFQTNLLPLIGDAMIDTAGKLADCANQALIAAQQAAIAIGAAASTVTGPGSAGTSTTSLTVGLGSQSLIIQAGKTLYPGMPMAIAASATPRDAMYGTLVSYNPGTGLTVVWVTNLSVTTPGTYITATAWTVSLSGPAGVTGVLNEFKGAPIATASTVNLDAATGNSLHLAGSTTITAITLAQGARRTVTLDGAPLLTHGSSLILPSAANIQGAAGDVVEFVGEGAGVVRCTNYETASGRALIADAYAIKLLATLVPTAGASAVDFLNIFSAPYDDYIVIGNEITVQGSGTNGIQMQAAVAGAAYSGVTYYSAINASSTSPAGYAFQNNMLGAAAGGKGTCFKFDFFNVNSAGLKRIETSHSTHSAATPAYDSTSSACALVVANAITGFRISGQSGVTFAATGSIKVYGVKKT